MPLSGWLLRKFHLLSLIQVSKLLMRFSQICNQLWPTTLYDVQNASVKTYFSQACRADATLLPDS